MTSWWVAAFVTVSAASFTQSWTGFGFALLTAPVLLMGLSPRTTVLALLLLNTFQCVLVGAREWRIVDGRRLVPLIAGSVVGTPIGAVALRELPPGLMHLAIGLTVSVSGLLLLVSQPRPLPGERWGSLVAGVASGLLNGGTGLSGPPVALYLSNQGWTRDQFRTSLVATFLASNIAALVVFAPLGLLDGDASQPFIVLAPAVALGWLVHRASHVAVSRISGPVFRVVVAVLVIVAGLTSALRS